MVGQQCQRIRPLKPAHRIPYSVHPAFLPGGENKIGNNLGIGTGAEGIAQRGEFLAQMLSINDIPVVSYRNRICPPTDNNGLGISQPAGTPGGIAIMSDGNISGELT